MNTKQGETTAPVVSAPATDEPIIQKVTVQELSKDPIQKFMQNPLIMQKFTEVIGKNSQSFITTALQVVNSNELLAKADPMTIYGSTLTAAVMRLSINPNLGHAYIVPFWNNKTKKYEAQLQIGWKGFVQLAQRSGEFKSVNTIEIYENQLGEINYLSGETEIKNVKPEGNIVGFIAHFKLRNGFEKSLYMSKEEMEKHAKKYSQTYKKGFGVWADGEDGFVSMAKKTVIKLLLQKYAPLSIEMQTAEQADQAVIDDEPSNVFEYPDNDHELTSPEEKKEAMKNSDSVAPVMP